MNTPVLLPLRSEDVDSAAWSAVPADVGPLRLFVVERGGWFDGRTWHAGDVVVCGGHAEQDERSVLAPRGRGRPALGHVREEGLCGVAGEPCHPDRWRVVGGVVAVLEGAGRATAQPSTRRAIRPAAARQLELFGAAA